MRSTLTGQKIRKKTIFIYIIFIFLSVPRIKTQNLRTHFCSITIINTNRPLVHPWTIIISHVYIILLPQIIIIILFHSHYSDTLRISTHEIIYAVGVTDLLHFGLIIAVGFWTAVFISVMFFRSFFHFGVDVFDDEAFSK